MGVGVGIFRVAETALPIVQVAGHRLTQPESFEIDGGRQPINFGFDFKNKLNSIWHMSFLFLL